MKAETSVAPLLSCSIFTISRFKTLTSSHRWFPRCCKIERWNLNPRLERIQRHFLLSPPCPTCLPNLQQAGSERSSTCSRPSAAPMFNAWAPSTRSRFLGKMSRISGGFARGTCTSRDSRRQTRESHLCVTTRRRLDVAPSGGGCNVLTRCQTLTCYFSIHRNHTMDSGVKLDLDGLGFWSRTTKCCVTLSSCFLGYRKRVHIPSRHPSIQRVNTRGSANM